jgi:hypothetical protein
MHGLKLRLLPASGPMHASLSNYDSGCEACFPSSLKYITSRSDTDILLSLT